MMRSACYCAGRLSQRGQHTMLSAEVGSLSCIVPMVCEYTKSVLVKHERETRGLLRLTSPRRLLRGNKVTGWHLWSHHTSRFRLPGPWAGLRLRLIPRPYLYYLYKNLVLPVAGQSVNRREGLGGVFGRVTGR